MIREVLDELNDVQKEVGTNLPKLPLTVSMVNKGISAIVKEIFLYCGLFYQHQYMEYELRKLGKQAFPPQRLPGRIREEAW